jgi:membrane-associated phospholipid phosphatase
LFLAYLSASGLLVVVFWNRVPGAWWLVSLHLLGMLLVALAAKWPAWRAKAPASLWLFRCWYPLPYVTACYKEMSGLIAALRGLDLDAELARLDFALWGVHPTVWLERFQTPALTEFLQIVYTLFLPMILLVAAWLWRQRRREEFRYYAFLLALGFLVSYVGYFLVPVRGPRWLLNPQQSLPLEGLWSFQVLRNMLDRLTPAHYDCFPSGHTEMIILAWWNSRRISANLFRVFSVYMVCMVFSTVYLRYHYTVDVFAGAVLALGLLGVAPYLHRAGKRP